MTTMSRIHDLSGSAAVQSQAVGGDRLKKKQKNPLWPCVALSCVFYSSTSKWSIAVSGRCPQCVMDR